LEEWRAEAKVLRRRYRDAVRARMPELCADEMEGRIRSAVSQAVSVKRAGEISGWCEKHIRRLITRGELTDVGRSGAPRVLLAQLPMKRNAGPVHVSVAARSPGRSVADEIAATIRRLDAARDKV
jgi:hypothetical protein